MTGPDVIVERLYRANCRISGCGWVGLLRQTPIPARRDAARHVAQEHAGTQPEPGTAAP